MESYSQGLYARMKLQQDKEIQLIDLCSGIAGPGELFCHHYLSAGLLHLLDTELGWS